MEKSDLKRKIRKNIALAGTIVFLGIFFFIFFHGFILGLPFLSLMSFNQWLMETILILIWYAILIFILLRISKLCEQTEKEEIEDKEE